MGCGQYAIGMKTERRVVSTIPDRQLDLKREPFALN